MLKRKADSNIKNRKIFPVKFQTPQWEEAGQLQVQVDGAERHVGG